MDRPSYLELDQMLGPWLLVLEVHRVCLSMWLVVSRGRRGVSHDPSGERIGVLLQHRHQVRIPQDCINLNEYSMTLYVEEISNSTFKL